MKDTQRIDELFGHIPKESEIFITKLSMIVDRIELVLSEKQWSQKVFAQKLDKNESEVSKWLNTPHNLTLKTISKMEAVLGVELITIPGHSVDNEKTKYIYLTIKAQTLQSVDEADNEPLPMKTSGISLAFKQDPEREEALFQGSLAS